MATAVPEKKKCEFWDKCYRKNKKHKEEFLHPEDVKNDVASTSKPRLVHDISVNDNDTAPVWRTGKKRKSEELDDEESKTESTAVASTSKPPFPKKKKVEEGDEEKITVIYSKSKTATNAADVTVTNNVSNNASSSATTVQYKGKRQKCKYWDKCYQTSEAHKKEFYHSGDQLPTETEESSSTKGRAKTPLNHIDDGSSVEFVESDSKKYKLKRNGEVYSCSCKGFLIQRAPINERTCKHLKEYLGTEFEKVRVVKNAVPKKTGVKAHIQVSLLLAHKYEEKSQNPVGWWISEKLDGVRAYWNGRCFYSRLGNAFYAPTWFTKDLPTDFTLDGELFGGRGEFQSTVSIVKTAECPGWKDIKYYVFDSPDMGKTPFEERMNKIKEYFEEHQPEHAVFVEQTKCKSLTHLDEKLTRILNLGGEGLMIRKPQSLYERTRSTTLLKIKKFYDAEAIVIGHDKGKGANAFRCGSLRCRMACGKEFSVGSGMTNKDRDKPPKIGTIITYKFQELSKSGTPRFPTYVGVCIDKTEPKDADIRPILNEEEA
ncbi:hypothetical protein BsWGS_16175 [Bradybaena similaris]